MTTPATWNPDNKHADLTLSNGNRTFSGAGGWKNAKATIGKNSGKWYLEISFSITKMSLGICKENYGHDYHIGQVADAYGLYFPSTLAGHVYNEGTAIYNYFTSVQSAPTIGMAVDLDNGKVWYRNHVGWGFIGGVAGDPATGDRPAATFSETFDFYPAGVGGNVTAYTVTINAGQDSFTYAVPSGFNSGWFGEFGTVALEDARLDLRASATELMDMATFLAMCADVRIDLPLDLTAGLIATQSLQAPLHAVGWARKFLMALLMATDGTVMRDLAAHLQATDGTTLADLAVSCRSIRQVPGYRAIIAQRLRSVKHGL